MFRERFRSAHYATAAILPKTPDDIIDMMEEKKTSDKSVTKPKGLKTSGQMKDTIHLKKKKKKNRYWI